MPGGLAARAGAADWGGQLAGPLLATAAGGRLGQGYLWSSSSRVVTSSGGYLKAMAHCGAWLVEPSWRVGRPPARLRGGTGMSVPYGMMGRCQDVRLPRSLRKRHSATV